MKADIHPKWYPEAKVVCACGNSFTVGSTVEEIHVEVCSNCHPFFTGQIRYADVAGRIEKFIQKQKTSGRVKVSKKEKRLLKRKQRVLEELSRPTSLEEVRKGG